MKLKLTLAILLFALVGMGQVAAAQNQPLSAYTLLTAAPITATSYVDGTCPDGYTCYYVVTASNSFGASVPSNQVSGAIPATGTHTATLTWAAVTGATGYSVYQGKAPAPPVVSETVQ